MMTRGSQIVIASNTSRTIWAVAILIGKSKNCQRSQANVGRNGSVPFGVVRMIRMHWSTSASPCTTLPRPDEKPSIAAVESSMSDQSPEVIFESVAGTEPICGAAPTAILGGGSPIKSQSGTSVVGIGSKSLAMSFYCPYRRGNFLRGIIIIAIPISTSIAVAASASIRAGIAIQCSFSLFPGSLITRASEVESVALPCTEAQPTRTVPIKGIAASNVRICREGDILSIDIFAVVRDRATTRTVRLRHDVAIDLHVVAVAEWAIGPSLPNDSYSIALMCYVSIGDNSIAKN